MCFPLPGKLFHKYLHNLLPNLNQSSERTFWTTLFMPPQLLSSFHAFITTNIILHPYLWVVFL